LTLSINPAEEKSSAYARVFFQGSSEVTQVISMIISNRDDCKEPSCESIPTPLLIKRRYGVE